MPFRRLLCRKSREPGLPCPVRIRAYYLHDDASGAFSPARSGAILGGHRAPLHFHSPAWKDHPMTKPRLPLNGFKVLDLTAHRAGPTAVRQLADWGADVIKIEPPGAGADVTGSRRDGPDFQNLHRNKRSLTLNLKTPEGLKIFMDLAKTADVVVENYKSTVKYKLGVDYESVKKVNPRIVYG